MIKKVVSGNFIKYVDSKNRCHRTKGPAIEYVDGYYKGRKEWYKHDKLHSYNDQPALIDNLGNLFWYKAGKQHREEDLPAQILKAENGEDKSWYQNGKLHRNNGPAVIYSFGDNFWFQKGKLHREDGPASEKVSGLTEWFNNDKLHRVGGPAYIDPENNYSQWARKGRLHRLNAPAIIGFDYKEWYRFGKFIKRV